MVGIVLLVVGLIVGLVTIFTAHDVFKLTNGILQEVIIPTFFYVIAAVIGVVIGLLIFLGAIMKT